MNWLGEDENNGSGVGTYTVYVSDNSGPFVPWLVDVPDTSDSFTGVNGHTYAFYSVAMDNVGHLEAPPAGPDAITHVVLPVTVVSVTVNGNSSTLGGSQRSLVKSVVYVFNQPVDLEAGVFTITIHSGSTGTVPTLNWATTDDGTTGSLRSAGRA